MSYIAGKYDVVVVGGGHAGCEAALAAARLGLKVAMFVINMDSVGNMPCNPNIGGTAKGHLVREIDALGGEMGKVADQTFIQSKILNSSKGPAVYSLRAQIDRRKYSEKMKAVLESQDNLSVKQAEIVELILDENKKVKGVKTHTETIYECDSVILTTGTYLKAKIIIGEIMYSGGPDGMFPANYLSENMKQHGIKMNRLKTGTPCRVNMRTVCTEGLEPQVGDKWVTPFSFENEELFEKWNGANSKEIDGHEFLVTNEGQIECFLTYTSPKTHQVINENLHRAPMFSGVIEGVGPRYCPSIEDKIVRFKDKERHQLFLEPMGLDTKEVYIGGMSTSMPEDVQEQMVHSVKGLENAEIMRSAYAIEYDAILATQLKSSLEFKEYENLFSAGQINGTSGYEEAAAQGLMAGINAARKLKGLDPIVLDRSQAYIGVLIDDIVTKGPKEPYRMMTSRAEYRLLLRQDNADRRLSEIGYEIGLVSQKRIDKVREKEEIITREINRLEKKFVAPSEQLKKILAEHKSTEVNRGISLAELIRRPELSYDVVEPLDSDMPDIPKYLKKQIEVEVKYAGYIKRQKQQVEQFKKMESKLLPSNINYADIQGLRIEARQKLDEIKPTSLGQASRIAGVSPADISVLLIYLEQLKRRNQND